MADVDVLTWTLVAAAAFITAVLFFVSRYQDDTKEKERKPRNQAAAAGGRPQHGGPVGARARRGRTAQARMRRQAHQDEDDEDDNYDMDEEGEVLDDPTLQDGSKIGKKKMRKLEEKAYKREMRERDQEEREERKRRQEQMEKQRKKDDERRDQEEKEREEEERKIKEEEERQEYEEYLKLKESFVVEDEGHENILTESESQSLLQEFIDHIKKNKVVILEELGAHFNLRTQEVINRVQDLQSDGKLTGVIDDRGKFIYISQEEMDAVAKFIKQRGRVSITELAEHSNMLINLQPDTVPEQVTA
ncbi:DDRGK domain-containing protein 1-like [Glandiceps talaboti]